MPPLENVFVIRHGESEEDVNPEIKSELVDSEIELTEKGILQAKEAAEKLRSELVDFEHITLYVSPYKRTQQTAEIILDTLRDGRIEMVVEPSIKSLNWGDITTENLKEIEQERYRIGVLSYHFPGGDNSTEYVGNIYDFVRRVITEKHINNGKRECAIIIGHGFSLRIIVKAFTEMSDEDFKWIKNPPSTFVARIYFDPTIDSFVMREPLPVREPNEIEK
ncbi:MAG: histidine phosphatase family protein [Candidatus Pacebacteria bacterium]|jgi:broad specificity phosphatase PhoE|nr:histidine phosphatase family protein [Candidatus Paceibacterota bacterium]